MWFTLLLIAVLPVMYFELIHKRDINRRANFFRLADERPLIGIGWRMFGIDNEELMKRLMQYFDESKGAFATWLGPQFLVGIADPVSIQTVLNSNECLDKPYPYKFLHNRTGLFTTDAETWKVHRRALNPVFNHKILLKFFPIFNEKSRVCVEQFEQYIGKPFDIYRPIYKVVTDVLINTVMDTKMEVQTEIGDYLYDTYMAIIQCIQHRIPRVWLKWDWVYSLTPTYRTEMYHFNGGYKFLRGIKESKEAELIENLQHGVDIIDESRQANTLNWMQKCFYMYRMGKFTEENLIEEIDTIYVGGTDTSTVTITSTIVMLAIHKEIQNRVIDELRDIFGEDQDREITHEDVTKMTYLEMVIKESLRHFPVGPFLGRTNSSNDLQIEHGTIPKGTFVLINVMRVHKDRNIWGPNVDRFYPEHFLPENISKMHPCSFLAFSAGPRNCIGIKYGFMVSKVIVAYILRRYVLSSHIKLEDVRTKMQMIIKIANTNPVKFEKRQW